METQDTQSMQFSELEFQVPSTFYQYQDTVELQGTLLGCIMDIDLVQGITTMINADAIVHSATKVGGGIMLATDRTSMVATFGDHVLMVWFGRHGGESTTPLSLLK